MKKLVIVFSVLFATLLAACYNDNPVISPDLTKVIQEESIFSENKTFIVDNGCTTITYQNRIGYDFNSALDSLIKKYDPILNKLATEGHYSGEGFNIVKETINVNFNFDNREFKLLTITDKANIYQILFSVDVIDDNGNYFRLIECED